jgi:hypothetical protein
MATLIGYADVTAVKDKLDAVDNKVDTTDPRLSDSRNPLAHTHNKSDITDFNEADYATASQGALADSALQTIPNASDTVVGGVKMRYDSGTDTLYLTNDGTDA